MIKNKIIIRILIVVFTLTLLSCDSLNKKNYYIPVIFYKKGFFNKKQYLMSVKFFIKKENKLFNYNCENIQPGFKVLNFGSEGNILYDNQKLEFVDEKKIQVFDSIIIIKKYINAISSGLNDLTYFYLNDDYGLILTHNLIYNNIIEYDTEKFKEVHKKIINDSLLFKDSDYVIQMNNELLELNN